MTHSIDSVRNYLNWSKADWRAYFRAHGQRIVQDWNQFELQDIPKDLREIIWSNAFQATMIKVGIFGSAALFDQIPSRWHTEVNPNIPVGHFFGLPRDFTHVTALATRMILDNTDLDEGVLIKFPGREPLFLLKLGSRWMVEHSTLEDMGAGESGINGRDTQLPAYFPELFEEAAELIDSGQKREVFENHFATETTFPPSLVRIMAQYIADPLTLDKEAMQKRKASQEIAQMIKTDLWNATVTDLVRERDACRIIATLFIKEHFEERVAVEGSSWVSTFSRIYSSVCSAISAFVRWCLSFFL